MGGGLLQAADQFGFVEGNLPKHESKVRPGHTPVKLDLRAHGRLLENTRLGE